MKQKQIRKKSISPLITVVLLILVAIVLIVIFLSFSKTLTKENLSRADLVLENICCAGKNSPCFIS